MKGRLIELATLLVSYGLATGVGLFLGWLTGHLWLGFLLLLIGGCVVFLWGDRLAAFVRGSGTHHHSGGDADVQRDDDEMLQRPKGRHHRPD